MPKAIQKDITSFRGSYDFLSNFYEAPVSYGGLCYSNNEAAFQAQKCQTEEEMRPRVKEKTTSAGF